MKKKWEMWIELIATFIIWGSIAREIVTIRENIWKINPIQLRVVLLLVAISACVILGLNMKNKIFALNRYNQGRTYAKYILQAKGWVKILKSF